MSPMKPDPSTPILTESELERLLRLTLENARVEGIVLTETEVATVRAKLRQHYGLASSGNAPVSW